MTLPDRLFVALKNLAMTEFGQQPGEYLRSHLQLAAMSPTGAVLKLQLPPVTISPDPNQPDLFEAKAGGAVEKLTAV